MKIQPIYANAVARHLVTALGAYLVHRGWVSAENWSIGSGVALVAVATLLSLLSKAIHCEALGVLQDRNESLRNSNLAMRARQALHASREDTRVADADAKDGGYPRFGLMLVLVFGCVLALGGSGCATANTVKLAQEARQAYQSFLAQPRMFQPMEIRGTNMDWHITGVTSIVMSAPLNPLEAMPKDPDTVSRIAEAAKDAVLGGAGIVTLGRVATQRPTIVTQPAPTIVRPEVVTPQVIQAGTP